MGSTVRNISDLLDNKGFVRGTNRYIGGVVTSRGGLGKARSQDKSKVNQNNNENIKEPSIPE